jgi:hypothetical protein
MCLQVEIERIWMMNMASHDQIGSTSETGSLASQLDCVAIPRHDETREMSSAEQGREECDPGNPHSSRAFPGDWADLMHELANTTTIVLMNAQILGWKLPPYSRLKRPLREIERNAQRGSELMKRLLNRLATDEAEPVSEDWSCMPDPSSGLTTTVTAQEPGVDSGSAVNLPPRMKLPPGSCFFLKSGG